MCLLHTPTRMIITTTAAMMLTTTHKNNNILKKNKTNNLLLKGMMIMLRTVRVKITTWNPRRLRDKESRVLFCCVFATQLMSSFDTVAINTHPMNG
mmetsp:Transcript_18520/g.25676  ORF Transcript_18520/g.25676 Transcript_18520/m.25676 type:complete len:96 (-) Transcript_18520:336-623(-)